MKVALTTHSFWWKPLSKVLQRRISTLFSCMCAKMGIKTPKCVKWFCLHQCACFFSYCKPSHNPNIGWCDFYVHMPLLSARLIFASMRGYVCMPTLQLRQSRVSIKQKAFPPVSFCNVPWSQNPPLMAKVATLIFSCCLKVRFYRYSVCPGQ